jgi:hypothetical protein
MDTHAIKENCWLLLVIPFIGILIFMMCALSSIFFKTYLKTLFHFVGISQVLHISERNTYPLTVLLLFTGLFIFVVIRHKIKDSLLSFLIFIASYGIYGYLFATIHALGFFIKPLLPTLLIASFFGFVVALQKIKAFLAIHSITPGVQNLFECSLWTSIFLVSSKMFYPRVRPDLTSFRPFTWVQHISGLSEAAIFFIFFVICLSALGCLVTLQSKKWYKLFKHC